MDNFAAGIFASSGVIKASLMIAPGDPGFVFLATFMGSMTAVGGGVVRDILVLRRVPVAVTSMYGTAAVIGSALQAQVMVWLPDAAVMPFVMPVWIFGLVSVFIVNELTEGLNPITHLKADGGRHVAA